MPSPPLPVTSDPAWAAESNLGRILGITTAVHLLAVTFVALRLYVRIKLVRSPGPDDWTMVAAVLCAFGGWLIFVVEGLYGLGRHKNTLDQLDIIKLNQASFWQSIIASAAAMALLKVSVALNLLRLSPSRVYSWILWVSIVFVCTYSFMGCMTFFLHCRPMEAHWDTRIKGECYPFRLFITFALINTSFNIFTDILFASLPIPIIARLRIKRRTRFYLIGVLSLGYLAVAAGIVIAYYQLTFAKDKDKTFNQWVNFWAFLQLNIGIIATCAPSLKPLVSKVLKLTDYHPTSDSYYGSQLHDTRALYTIGGSSLHLMPPRNKNQDALRGLGDSNKAKRSYVEDVEFEGVGNISYGSITTTFYESGSEGDRSGSEESILGTWQGQPQQQAEESSRSYRHGEITRMAKVVMR